MRKERRDGDRVGMDESVAVSWVDSSGAHYHVHARCLDVSERGLRLELLRRIDSDAYVNVKAEKYKLNASARVRNVTPKGLKYHVGLEFNSAWKWKELAQYLDSRPGGAE